MRSTMMLPLTKSTTINLMHSKQANRKALLVFKKLLLGSQVTRNNPMKFKMTLKVLKLHLTSEAASQENSYYHQENVKNAIRELTYCLLLLIISLNSVWIVHQQIKLCAMEVQKSILNLAIGVALL